jgi:hypothetical protein
MQTSLALLKLRSSLLLDCRLSQKNIIRGKHVSLLMQITDEKSFITLAQELGIDESIKKLELSNGEVVARSVS